MASLLRTALSRSLAASPKGARFSSTSASGGATSQAPFWASRTAAYGSTAAVVGSIALYASAFGEAPFLPTVSANMKDEGLHPTAHPWSHNGHFETFDHASIRRGFQVYREVCASCHSLSRIAWRNLVGVSHTVDEVKEIAADYEYQDGPNDEGEMFTRPGKLADYIPAPYPNDEASRAANAGALPPDLSLMTKARHGGADYIFSLLTGYVDPPAGVHVPDGMNFNPYFPGTQIGMARVLFDGLVEYDDGTPATTSQMAKDVVTFLTWAAQPEHDERKKLGLQYMIIASTMLALSIWVKRYKWASITNRRLQYNPPKH